MTLTKIALACAFAAAAVGAHAVPTYSVSTDITGSWGVTSSYTAVDNAGVVTGADTWHAVPQGIAAGGSYYYSAWTGSSLTLTNINASTFSFLWGSPDTFNTVTFNTTQGSFDYSGASLAAAGTKNSIVFTASNTGTINSVTFTSSEPAFEFAVAVAAVPEPETYALMAAGLLAVGFVARRNAKR